MATRAPANDLQAWLAGLEPEPCAAGEGPACLRDLLGRDVELPQRATLNVFSARRRSDGSYGSVQPQIKAAHSHARQVTEFDRRLLQFVEARQSDPEPPWRLEGAWGVEVLRMLARSGRGHWQSEQAPALTVDVAQAGKWRWQLGDDGRSRLQLEVAAAAVVLPLQPPG